MRRVSEISAGVISVAKLPKFRPLFSKRFARRKEGEKKPDTGRSANLPQGENVLRVSLLSPPLFLFFFQTEARVSPPLLLLLLSHSKRKRRGREVSRTHYRAQAAAHFYGNGWNQWETRFVFVFRTRKQSLSARVSHLFLYPRLTNGEDGFGIIYKICDKKRE